MLTGKGYNIGGAILGIGISVSGDQPDSFGYRKYQGTSVSLGIGLPKILYSGGGYVTNTPIAIPMPPFVLF
jgi:hypothetical protein